MEISQRIDHTVSTMRVLAEHGLDQYPIYQQLKDSLFEDAELMFKAVAKGRRQDLAEQRKKRTAARANGGEQGNV